MGNLSIPSNWPTIIRRNLIHILLGTFSPSHVGGTVGKNHQTLFNKENARDTYFFTKKIYKLLMWHVVIGKWKKKNDVSGGPNRGEAINFCLGG